MAVINMDTINVRFKGDAHELKDTVKEAKTTLDDFADAAKDAGNDVNSGLSKGMTSSVDKLTQFEDKLTNSYNRFLRLINVGKKFGKIMYDCFEESNDYIESLNLYQVSMRENFEEGKKIADQLENIAGINSKEWMTYQSSFKNMIEGFGHESDNAVLMSENLSMLAYDLSSLYNQDVKTVFTKLNSAMAGQIKGVKEYGVDLSMAALGEYARAHGIELSTAKMTQAQKATLRYNMLLERTKVAQGDLGRTLVSPANMVRLMSNQWDIMKRNIGNVVGLVMTRLLPYLKYAVELVGQLAKRLADMWGFKLPEIDYSGLDASMLDASEFEEDTEEAADNLDEASKNAKKLKKTLMSFDEIHALTAPVEEATKKAKDTTPYGGGLDSLMGLGLDDYSDTFLGELEKTAAKQLDKLRDVINQKLSKFLIVAGVIAVGLGALLMFTGHWVAGVTLLLTGLGMLALGTYITWNSQDSKLQEQLSGLAIIVGAFLFVLGVFLTMAGQVALGFGLMIAGIAAVTTGVVIAWGSGNEQVRASLVQLTSVVGGFLAVLGVVLLCAGQVMWGIALMVAGIALFTTGYVLAWNSGDKDIVGSLTKTLETLAPLVAVIGVVLLCAGHLVAGIGLIVAGIGIFAATAAVEWNKGDKDVAKALMETLGIIAPFLAILGVILITTGHLLLGIGLLVLGIGIFGATVGIAWNSGDTEFVASLSKTLAAISGFLFVLGIFLTCVGMLALGIPLMVLGFAALFTAGALAWNKGDSKLKESLKRTFSIIAGAAMVAVGLLLCCTGAFLLGLPLIIEGGKKVWRATDGSDNAMLQWVHKKLDAVGTALSTWWSDITGWDWSISFTANLTNAWNSVVDFFDNIGSWFGNLNIGANIGIPGYATGGTPASGQLFFARENGMPEMVGRYGTQTAVMNNEQITDAVSAAVSQGVFEAMMAVMGSSDNNNNGGTAEFYFYDVNDEIIAKAAMRGQQRLDRRMSPVKGV